MNKSQHQKFMRLAIEEAKKSSEDIGCGAVIVKNGKIMAKAHNTQYKTYNASAHAEINAIGKAGKKLESKKLNGCTMYCTTEPCIMCLSAASYARIDRLVFGLTMKEVYDLERIIDIVDIGEFLQKSPHKFQVVADFFKDECKVLI